MTGITLHGVVSPESWASALHVLARLMTMMSAGILSVSLSLVLAISLAVSLSCSFSISVVFALSFALSLSRFLYLFRSLDLSLRG